jgi:hypothetical protein
MGVDICGHRTIVAEVLYFYASAEELVSAPRYLSIAPWRNCMSVNTTIRFTLAGRVFVKSRQDFIEAARKAEFVHKTRCSVVIEGRRLSTRQVLAAVTCLPMGQIANQTANRILQRLKFPIDSDAWLASVDSYASNRINDGMLFYNDEGTENGGLIFSERKNDKGEIVDSGVSRSFERYGTGQTVQLAGVDDSENHFVGLQINDARRQRVRAGRKRDGFARISLAGTDGKERIRLQLSLDGKASIIFLDSNGKVLQELAPTK